MRDAWSGLRRTGGHPATRTPAVVCGRKFCCDCGRWRPLVDFPHAGPRKGPYSYCGHCTWHRNRRYRQTHPTALERKRESDRFVGERRRREAGAPPRRFHNRHSVIDRVERVFLDPAPLIAELDRRVGELDEVARRAGIADRAIHRIRTGESKRVRIDIADKLALALGLTGSLIWEDW